ncbi:two pore domain potassium channel family protein [Patescibacteria group bacterium]|nr:two pore domain potassium channel family protein [Patescibacteria group bacterium]
MNIIEITMSFAVLYLSLGAIGNSNGVITQGSDALYFSFVTFSTIGYGDILPILPIGKTLVIFETLISFLFITIIASSFVSGLEIRNNDTQD